MILQKYARAKKESTKDNLISGRILLSKVATG